MLLYLKIENFALIDELELEFAPGLNVLTGETGAGKSIILDAIDIVLGGKVSNRTIRTGTKRASIEANFRIDSSLNAWLNEQEIDLLEDGELVCSREITNDASRSTKGEKSNLRSRSRVNGIVVNRRLIEQLRDRLVEITAQGQTVQLMSPAHQRGLLDLYGGSPILQQRDLCTSAYLTSQEAFQALEKRRQSEQQRLQRLDWLEYQIHELKAANLTDSEELTRLEQESQRLSHVVDLQQNSYRIYQALYQNDSGSPAGADLLGQAETLLNEMVQYDPQLQSILELVSGARIQLVEASHQINTYGDSLETDPARLQEVEERIIALKQICRKYGPTLANAIAHYEKLYSELAELSGEGQSLEDLEKKYALCQKTLIDHCHNLTQLRRQAGSELEKQLIAQLKPLAMEKVQFQVAIEPITPNGSGADKVTFTFSPNPGEPLQPLSATASGGEMSRFLLALKSCFSSSSQERETLIFDEIDAGVSGRVAGAIAERLHQLSQQHQVLCVTHQPLIAAMADRHFRVDKQIIDPAFFTLAHRQDRPIIDFDQPITETESALERTVVRVSHLDKLSHRQEEIALLAGGQSGEEAMTFAESLLNKAKLR
ncbi:MAG TPA: DNA repair protein RecN [Cyanobacteria bacterium UBA11149]|nr:DNA repair protein RecN [Cyanobacteria bacterium UBA11367]HBE59450.1 DNA repair protein RecN [Cyanobacteria bacterium UBA11366]HBR72176.1 DNA repair protein RecN [Cyanobacteria bacterium UBA11159]HBS72443.1 DNA repair protein RecN [Cyanobacteria bacterium UBA11153]HBW89895.1 DNA repair protein RecN [Cyanobacteria bacterium UBA11149]HCA97608.1 DNA repair protein RecN [Cyanobacteria bacterium UBA9226]